MRQFSRDFALIARFTRNWIHYGLLAHVGVCVVVGAIEGLFGN